MKINRHEKRLKAIKTTYPLFLPKKCICCKNEYVREKMWKVFRWGVNKTAHEYDYCKNCMPDKESVLNRIDTDVCLFGIAGVDDFWGHPEKDMTNYNKAFERFRKERAV